MRSRFLKNSYLSSSPWAWNAAMASGVSISSRINGRSRRTVSFMNR